MHTVDGLCVTDLGTVHARHPSVDGSAPQPGSTQQRKPRGCTELDTYVVATISSGSMSEDVDTNAIGWAPLKDLEAWAQATEREIDEIRGQMLPLEERMGAARERLDLIRRLMGLADGSKRQPTSAPRSSPREESAEGRVPPGATVEDHVEAILSERGDPMHIGALRAALIEQGVPLPGRGDEANIIVRLRRDEARFARTGRGTYALAAWGLPAVAATQRKKVRRRRAVKS